MNTMSFRCWKSTTALQYITYSGINYRHWKAKAVHNVRWSLTGRGTDVVVLSGATPKQMDLPALQNCLESQFLMLLHLRRVTSDIKDSSSGNNTQEILPPVWNGAIQVHTPKTSLITFTAFLFHCKLTTDRLGSLKWGSDFGPERLCFKQTCTDIHGVFGYFN